MLAHRLVALARGGRGLHPAGRRCTLPVTKIEREDDTVVVVVGRVGDQGNEIGVRERG